MDTGEGKMTDSEMFRGFKVIADAVRKVNDLVTTVDAVKTQVKILMLKVDKLERDRNDVR